MSLRNNGGFAMFEGWEMLSMSSGGWMEGEGIAEYLDISMSRRSRRYLNNSLFGLHEFELNL